VHSRTSPPRSSGLVLVSGGLDSAAALFWAKGRFDALWALSAEVAGRPAAERRAAERLAERAGARLLRAELPFFKDVERLRAEGFEAPRGRGVPGLIPLRNLVLWSAAAYFAEAVGASAIVGGHLGTDSDLFPDASPEFFERLESLIGFANRPLGGRRVRLLLPWARKSKRQLLAAAVRLRVPLEWTWSCYADGERPCGECLSCLQRANAFRELGIDDPALGPLRGVS
jgi:7-cyano-7-deazaguanine synthase